MRILQESYILKFPLNTLTPAFALAVGGLNLQLAEHYSAAILLQMELLERISDYKNNGRSKAEMTKQALDPFCRPYFGKIEIVLHLDSYAFKS